MAINSFRLLQAMEARVVAICYGKP